LQHHARAEQEFSDLRAGQGGKSFPAITLLPLVSHSRQLHQTPLFVYTNLTEVLPQLRNLTQPGVQLSIFAAFLSFLNFVAHIFHVLMSHFSSKNERI